METEFEINGLGNNLVWDINDTYIVNIDLYQTFNDITTPLQQLTYSNQTSYVNLITSLDSVNEIGIYNYTVVADMLSVSALFAAFEMGIISQVY